MPPKQSEKAQVNTQPTSDIAIDFSAVKPFEPMDEKNPDGTDKIYLFEISNLTYVKAKNYAKGKFTVLAPEKDKKRVVWRNYSFNTDALPYLYTLLQAADPSVQLDEKFKFNESKWMGLQIAATVKNEEYDDGSGTPKINPRLDRVMNKSKYKEV